MKKYNKPITERVECIIQLPLMLSLVDEIGDGQLANTFEFEDEGDKNGSNKALKDQLSIGF